MIHSPNDFPKKKIRYAISCSRIIVHMLPILMLHPRRKKLSSMVKIRQIFHPGTMQYFFFLLTSRHSRSYDSLENLFSIEKKNIGLWLKSIKYPMSYESILNLSNTKKKKHCSIYLIKNFTI